MVFAASQDDKVRAKVEQQLNALNRKLDSVELAHDSALQAAAPAYVAPPERESVAGIPFGEARVRIERVPDAASTHEDPVCCHIMLFA